MSAVAQFNGLLILMAWAGVGLGIAVVAYILLMLAFWMSIPKGAGK